MIKFLTIFRMLLGKSHVKSNFIWIKYIYWFPYLEVQRKGRLRINTTRDSGFTLSLSALPFLFGLLSLQQFWPSYPYTEMSRKRIDGHSWIFSRTKRNFSREPSVNFFSHRLTLYQVSRLFLSQLWQEPLLGLGWAFLL